MHSIADRIEKAVSAEGHRSPAVLVPIRSMEDLPPLVRVSDHVAYETFQPGADLPVLPGSEADIGGLVRDLVQSSPKYLDPSHGIDHLRLAKARTLYLLADYAGSGTQALRYLETFRRNTTIASWVSYGYLEIRVLVYAASLESADRIREKRGVRFEFCVDAKSSLSTDWSNDQRTAIEAFCRHHWDPSLPGKPLGYGDSFGLHLTNMRVPNNLPQVLIRGGGVLPGIFANRRVPEPLVSELREYVPTPSLERTLRNLGAEDIADILESSTRPVKGLRALSALYLLEYGLDIDRIRSLLGLDEPGMRRLCTTLIALGCIDMDWRLTPRGRTELGQARFRGGRADRYRHERFSAIDYLPTQLR